MAYEKFERTSVRVEAPTLSVISAGRIGFNAAACRVLEQNAVRSVVILWDKSAHAIALQPAPKGDRDSYAITFARDGHAATFAAKAFLKHIGWSSKERQTVPATWNPSQRVLEAKLPAKYLYGGLQRIRQAKLLLANSSASLNRAASLSCARRARSGTTLSPDGHASSASTIMEARRFQREPVMQS